MTTEQLEKGNELQEKLDRICNVIYLDGATPKIKGNVTDKNLADAAWVVRNEFAALLYATFKELEEEFAAL